MNSIETLLEAAEYLARRERGQCIKKVSLIVLCLLQPITINFNVHNDLMCVVVDQLIFE